MRAMNIWENCPTVISGSFFNLVPSILDCAGDKIEKNEIGWACGAYGWGEGVYRVLMGKPEGKRPLRRPRHRWVDNIRMDLQMGCGYMDWIGLAQDRDRWQTLVSVVMNLRVLWNVGIFLTSCKPVSFSRRTLQHEVSKYVSKFTCCLLCSSCLCRDFSWCK